MHQCFIQLSCPAPGRSATMKILALKMHGRVGDESDFVLLDPERINYIDLWEKTRSSTKALAIHTSNGSFLGITTLNEISIVYARYGFVQLDRSIVVNSNQINSVAPHNKGTMITFYDGSKVHTRKIMY